jgi:single-strand DNA-binding protein
MNNITLHGRIGQKELKEVSGQKLCKLSVACTRTWKNQQGEKQEQTSWFSVSFWGNAAETVDKWFAVGDPINVTGSMESRQVETEGKKITFWELKANGFDFPLSKPKKDQDAPAQSVPSQPAIQPETITAPGEQSDLPF